MNYKGLVHVPSRVHTPKAIRMYGLQVGYVHSGHVGKTLDGGRLAEKALSSDHGQKRHNSGGVHCWGGEPTARMATEHSKVKYMSSCESSDQYTISMFSLYMYLCSGSPNDSLHSLLACRPRLAQPGLLVGQLQRACKGLETDHDRSWPISCMQSVRSCKLQARWWAEFFLSICKNAVLASA